MASNLIPEPNIQATNIPSGGAPQVSFAPWATPKNTFANLSKTIGAAAQTMVNFNDLEDREAESRDAWKGELEQIHGLVKTGQLSEADYLKIQREANGKAQKEGIIRAHENWSTIREVSQERSKKRLGALSGYFQDRGGIDRMSNPDPDQASSFAQEQTSAFEDLAETSLGRDSQGNEVYLGLDDLSPMEMVAFARGQSVLETATLFAVEELKAKRSVEASTIRFSGEVHDVIKDMLYEPTVSMGIPGKGNPIDEEGYLLGLRLNQLRESASKAHSSGVKGTSSLVLVAATDLLTQYQEDASLVGDDPREAVNTLLDQLQGDLSLHEADGKPVPFAGAGTETHLKIENLRNSVHTGLEKRLTALDAAQPDKKDMVLAYGWDLLDAAESAGIDKSDPEVKKEYYRMIKDYGRRNGYYEFNAVTTQFDDWFTKTEGRLNLEHPDVLDLDTDLRALVGIDTTEDEETGASMWRAKVNKLFTEKKIDAALRSKLLDRVDRKAADALGVTSAKQEKSITWFAEYKNTLGWMQGQLNRHMGVTTPGDPKAGSYTPTPHTISIANGVARKLHKKAKDGGDWMPPKGLNPLENLTDAQLTADLKIKLGAATFAQYQNFLSMEVSFGDGALNEDNYLERNATAAAYVDILSDVYSAMQAIQQSRDHYTADELTATTASALEAFQNSKQ